jgi:hypothetical protein
MPAPKAAEDALNDLLHARCTRAEKDAVRAKAKLAGLRVSAYTRRAVVDSKVLPADPLLQLVIAINRAGNLVNQQMPIAHATGEIPSELRRANTALAEALEAVTAALS